MTDTPTEDARIVDGSRDRRYFTMLPNLVIDMGLSPYALALYARIKRRAGEDGACWENTRNLAAACKMSIGKVSQAKQELVKAGLIVVKKQAANFYCYDEITIVDIWKQNACSYSEQACSQDEKACSPGERNKNPIKNNPSEETEREQGRAHLTRDVEKSKTDFSRHESIKPSSSSKPPIVEAIKEITGRYPNRKLWERLEKDFPEFDTEKMHKAFEAWIANGYSPMNINGWLYDWYKTGMYYVPRYKKLPDSATEEHDNGPVSERDEVRGESIPDAWEREHIPVIAWNPMTEKNEIRWQDTDELIRVIDDIPDEGITHQLEGEAVKYR